VASDLENRRREHFLISHFAQRWLISRHLVPGSIPINSTLGEHSRTRPNEMRAPLCHGQTRFSRWSRMRYALADLTTTDYGVLETALIVGMTHMRLSGLGKGIFSELRVVAETMVEIKSGIAKCARPLRRSCSIHRISMEWRLGFEGWVWSRTIAFWAWLGLFGLVFGLYYEIKVDVIASTWRSKVSFPSSMNPSSMKGSCIIERS
jgi:hypothetical protein